jgi:excisionase family DNA binding protein
VTSAISRPAPPSVEVATIETNKITGWISIDDAASWLGMGRRFVEELVAKHDVVVKKFGTRTRILFSSLQDWAARQPDWETR